MSVVQARQESRFIVRYHGTAMTPTVHLAKVLTGSKLTQTRRLNVFVSECVCVFMRGKARRAAMLA